MKTFRQTRLHRRFAVSLVAVLAALAGACQRSGPSEAPNAPVTPDEQHANAAPKPGVAAQLAQLRAVTAKYRTFASADSAGYSTRITGCMTDPQLGGMGFHYGKATAIDATADALEPEVLLYEPEPNGQLRLVAVEFIIPYALRPRDGPPPTLFDQPFVQNDAFELWGLHAWVWRHNPAGMFADWNPEVNCDAVAPAEHMTHTH